MPASRAGPFSDTPSTWLTRSHVDAGVRGRVALQVPGTLPDARTPTPEDWSALSAAWRTRLDDQIRLLVALRDDLDACIGCGCLSLERCALYNPDDVAARLGHGPRYLKGNTPRDAGVDV